tara:strand:- start:232 stop:501 length:270 start_codon:yes stop_codon:yes gene_type:complete
MSRYRYTKKQKINKKDYYTTTVYKKIIEKNTDSYFIAVEGDRCDNLANRFYGDSQLWWFIARANNLTSNNIPAGTSLRIPATTEDAEGL